MPRTLEEQAVGEIDTLWQAALFLNAGDAARAEALVVSTVTSAFRERVVGETVGPEHHPLEGHLVHVFLRQGRSEARAPVVRPARPDSGPPPDVDASPESLFSAAASVPAEPRAALWLVMIRRWSYAEAASVLGVDRDRVRELLRHRDRFMAVARGRPAEARPRRALE